MNNAVSVSAVNRRHMRQNRSAESACGDRVGGEAVVPLTVPPLLGWPE